MKFNTTNYKLEEEKTMWGLIIIGLLFLFIFPPLGIAILIIGLIVAALKASNKVECSQCREKIKIGAKVCPHCRSELEWYRVQYNKLATKNK
jgi:hypothetical protein